MLLLIVILAIHVIILFLMPKRLSRSEIYVTWAIVTLITTLVDALLGATLHLYYYYDDKVEIRDLLIEIMTGFYGPIMLNFMPKKFDRFVVYTIVWTLVSLLAERIAVMSHVLTYIHWSTWYSVPFYVAGCFFLRWHLQFIRSK